VRSLEREVERLAARIAELELEKAQMEAFAAVAAHELVEPLVMTEAYASIISNRLTHPEHADSRRDLHALGRGVARMRLLAESVLHEARSSQRELARRPVDTSALVSDCLALLRPDIVARNARIEISELPEVAAEEALLNGVFSNLFINALKYSPRQGSLIRIWGEREHTVCRFSVESEGSPIPVEDRERIFELYQRGQGERRAGGAGLGLTICRRIVERHGGEIGVVPLNGSGNRFYFTIPT
jgi:signal transduction histidine kinase